MWPQSLVCVLFSSHNEQLDMAGSWIYMYPGLGFGQEAPTEWEHSEEVRVSTGSDNSDPWSVRKK